MGRSVRASRCHAAKIMAPAVHGFQQNRLQQADASHGGCEGIASNDIEWHRSISCCVDYGVSRLYGHRNWWNSVSSSYPSFTHGLRHHQRRSPHRRILRITYPREPELYRLHHTHKTHAHTPLFQTQPPLLRCSGSLLHRCMWYQSTNRKLVNQPGDTSDGIEIAGADALALNGSTIKRASTFPSQSANLTLYSGGSSGGNSSISGDSDGTLGLYGFSLRGDDGGGGDEGADSSDLPPVAVDCSVTPFVLNVTATAFAGEYGAGQRIYFQVCRESTPYGSKASPFSLPSLASGQVLCFSTLHLLLNRVSSLTFTSCLQDRQSFLKPLTEWQPG